jgi:hypothetical protein
MKNRRAEVRKVKHDLTRAMNQRFAGKKPTAEEAQAALETVLKFYSLPRTIGVRLNRVKDGTPPVLELEIYNPIIEARNEMLKHLTDMAPEAVTRMGRQLGKTESVMNFVKAATNTK